ncbi:MAG: hypothetical protein RMJ43_11990 [Chloroherpetonaceae bacterium]|nr:hypothetical protein [Chthonomonadaceae bacterium]MDW8208547.1 hypothetical protein [Chloroherpetonaceae bacterium]
MSEGKNAVIHGEPRRRFLSSAFLSLSSVVTGALAGCTPNRPAPNAALDTEYESLRRVPPERIGYRQVAQWFLRLQEPRGIALAPDGGLYAVGDRLLVRLAPDGSLRESYSLDAEPTCVTCAPDGLLYLGLTDRVGVYTPQGHRVALWDPHAERSLLTAIAVGDREVYVADAGSRVVLRCDLEGRVRSRIGARDDTRGYSGLILPSPHLDVVIAPDGQVLVSNPGQHRIETHTPEGRFVSAWGRPGSSLDAFCGCCNPTDFALLPDGRFVTCEKGIPRVKVYSAQGVFESVVAPPEVFPSHTLGLDLAAGRDGSISVLDAKSACVRVFIPAGGRAA